MADSPITGVERTKLPVVDYDFKFQGEPQVLQVTMWPTLGDTVKELKERFVFSLKRDGENIEETVYKAHLLDVRKVKTARARMSKEEALEILKRMKEAQHGKHTEVLP